MKLSRSLLAPVTGIFTLLVVWEAAVQIFDIQRFVLLAPSEIVRTLVDDPGSYLDNALVTAGHMAAGLAISLMVALVVGALMAASRFLEEAIQPVLVVILVTPWVAYITSVVIWLDFGDRPVIFLVAFTTFPVFAFGVVGGMRSAEPAARELLASVDASRWEVLWRLRLPSALPSIFTTSRFAIALALAAAYFSEGAAAKPSGLGFIGRQASANSNAEVLWTTIFCTAALGIVGLAVVSLGERFLLHWHVSQRDG